MCIRDSRYGRKIPKHAHGTINLKQQTSSAKKIVTAVMELYDRIMAVSYTHLAAILTDFIRLLRPRSM